MLKTRQKILIASAMFRAISLLRRTFGLTQIVRVKRRGVRWELDLSEGIDLAIYALGALELRTLRSFERLVQPGATVLDIGANIGAHTLHLARMTGPRGKVIAVEPTAFAWCKLLRNIELNPELAGSITPKQAMLVDSLETPLEAAIYSSWPIAPVPPGGKSRALHELHGGQKMSTAGARVLTVDSLLAEVGAPVVHFLKIDVDGHEPAVLAGAERTLSRDRPLIAIEFAPYLYEDDFGKFEAMIEQFSSLSYELTDLESGRKYCLDAKSIRAAIPRGASRNILARSSFQSCS